MIRSASVFLLLILNCLAGQSATINWDFDSGSSTASSSIGSGYGNSWAFSASGLAVVATGWGVTGNTNTTFQSAQLGRYGTGLGVCNRSEGLGCGDPEHQVDNSGQAD